ncbi:hypothetical protein A605_04705 [Corynebacterium halotolerans YIM 70093 = DSM 44683]|uniref:Uncharacterized protein n=1 Tax=Corynebacterium halotolerans YIM 70093 = DSM 44683 TaxID=1121362 RepID=M1MW48_9CORY|nr:hypothetical protein A605_04705 [Corynebacterium halotolerans YIM 70093 = DSM 44683]
MAEKKKAKGKAGKKARAKAEKKAVKKSPVTSGKTKADKKLAKKAAKQAKLRDPGKWKIKSKCCRSNPRCKSCPVVFKRLERAGAFEREDVDFGAELKLARRW